MIKFSRVYFISSASLCMIWAIVHINKSNKRLRPFPRLRFISLTSGRVWAPNKRLTGYPKSNHLDSVSTPQSSPYVGEKYGCPHYLSCYLKQEVPSPNIEIPPHDAPFPFPGGPSLPAWFLAVAGHFSLEHSPSKPDDTHITIAMTPLCFSLYFLTDC